ncbi:MAG: patatin family protein [Clostridia bacterium]|nr:patatin family protein [Clostridia bacterium]
MKKGLILEGGAMRGMFTAGVMDVLMENGIVFDGAVGVSAGAAFGVNYKSGQIGRVLRYNTRFVRDKRYCGMRVLLKTGNIYSTEFCYNEVPLKHDPFDFDAYARNPMEFYLVCTDVETGEAVYHRYAGREDHCFDWIRASASMPLVSQIVEIDGRKLLDGGIADSIPVRFFEQIGYNRNIAVLTRPRGYQKSKNSTMPLVRLKYRRYPKFVEAIANRHNMYNETLAYIEQREQAGELFVIRPAQELPVSRVEKDPEKLREAYEIGRKTATVQMAQITEYLSDSAR